jgi:hypothetical protein
VLAVEEEAKTQEVLVLEVQAVVVQVVQEQATQLLGLLTQEAVVVDHIRATQAQAALA